VILNESVLIDKDAFVAKAQKYLKVDHTISVGYMFQSIDGFMVHNAYLMYSYNFGSGLALGLQFFCGVSGKKNFTEKYTEGAMNAVDTYEKSFRQMGLNILFSKSIGVSNSFGLVPYVGPSFVGYQDKTTMILHDSDGGATLSDKPVTVEPTYLLFGIKGGLLLEYKFTSAIKIFCGADFQYFPNYSATKNFDWVDSSVPTSGTVSLKDTVKMTGLSALAGASYGF